MRPISHAVSWPVTRAISGTLGEGSPFFNGSTLDMRFNAGQYRGAQVADLTVTRASAGYAEDTSGVWSSFSSNVPRITSRGLLVEEARTNSALRSDEFDNASWTKSNVTVSANSLLSPFGAVDADTLTASGANGTCTQAVTTAAVSWTFSVFLRRLTGTGNVQITMDGTTWVTQTITDTAWTRCSVTQTGVAGTSNPGIRLVTSGDAVYASCAQAELGAFATSPIRTTTVAVTRALDVVSLQSTAFSSWYTNAAAGTYYAEASTAATVSNSFIMCISDGTTANEFGSYFSVAGTSITHLVTAGGVTQAAPFNSGLVLGNVLKAALGYAANDMQGVYNGSLMTVDTTNTVPTVSRLTFGTRGDNTFRLNGYIRRVAYFPSRLSNAELQALTT